MNNALFFITWLWVLQLILTSSFTLRPPSHFNTAIRPRHFVIPLRNPSRMPRSLPMQMAAPRAAMNPNAAKIRLSNVQVKQKQEIKEKPRLKERVRTKTKPSLRDEIEKDWRLVLHDDNEHEIDDVADWIYECCPLCSRARSQAIVIEVHTVGAATVCVASKKLVDEYADLLIDYGLTVSVAPDEDFQGGPPEWWEVDDDDDDKGNSDSNRSNSY